MSKFIATPTMRGFMTSPKFARLLAGPIGSGKSVCCTHELLRWATEQQANTEGVRQTRFLIIRNTRDQLMSTTYKTVTEWITPGKPGVSWKAMDKTLTVKANLADGTRIESEWMFLPLDEPADIRKALSLESTGVWINEWREIHPDIVQGILSRTDRYPPPKDGTPITRAGGIMDTNMPDEETWHWDMMEEAPSNWSIHIQPRAILTVDEFIQQEKEDPDEDLGIEDAFERNWWVNPRMDNYDYLSKDYYKNNIPGKSEDFIRTFLRCEYGRSADGLPVYDKSFRPDFHVADEVFAPVRSESYPLVVGVDFGRTPCAIFGQLDTRGRVVILSEVVSHNMGIETFIVEKLKPHIFEHYAGFPLVFAPDPAGFMKQQLNEITLVDALKHHGFKCIKPVTNKPELRIEAVERLLLRQVDGAAMFQINAHCKTLIKGFRYGYRYKVNKKGIMDDKKPDKNDYSHPHDALQYLCLIVDQSVSGYARRNARREIQPVRATGWT